MRQAIVTKYIGPTDYKPGRVKATADAGSITVSWDHDLGVYENHERAAKLLASKYGWLDSSKLIGGGMPASTPYAYCFVQVPR